MCSAFSFFETLIHCDLGIGIDIFDNPVLEDLSGFKSLEVVNGDLVICRNGALKTVKGFEGVSRVHLNLIISQNTALDDLTGFDNIKEVGGLISIQDNLAIDDLIVRTPPPMDSL